LQWQHEADARRAELDLRLKAHRSDPKRPKLGLDQLCENKLSDDDRLLLIALSLPAASHKLALEVLGELGPTYFGALSVSDAIAILDPANVADWLRYRQLFRPGAPLRKLIDLSDPRGDSGPETLSPSNAGCCPRRLQS